MNKYRRLIQIIVFIAVVSVKDILFAGIGVDPVVSEVVVNKDTPTTGIFKVLNSGKNPAHIRVSPEKWRGMDIDISKWLTLEPMGLELAQNEEKEVKYSITSPEGTSGELRCMVFFIADEVGEQRSNVGVRFGVPIYAILGGTDILDVEIADVEVEYRDKVLNGTILVNNKSNIHIRPNIDIDILDSRDRLVTSFGLPYGQPAQAGQNRPFTFQGTASLDNGKYKIITKVDYGRMYGLEGKVVMKKIALVVKNDEETK